MQNSLPNVIWVGNCDYGVTVSPKHVKEYLATYTPFIYHFNLIISKLQLACCYGCKEYTVQELWSNSEVECMQL